MMTSPPILLTVSLLVNSVAAQMRWVDLVPPNAPAARQDHGMVLDSVRQRLVLFGGWTLPGQLADTWEWTGSAWLSRATTGPGARSLPAMAFDSVRARTVLFGGWNRAGSFGGFVAYYSDTWEWDGTTWTQAGSSGPGALAGASMAFDPIRGRTVLFGGNRSHGTSTTVSDEVWEWDGSVWRQIPSGAGPVARMNASLTFVPGRNEVVLAGGDQNPGALGDMWSWDGSRWAFVAWGPTTSRHSATWNPSRGRLVLRGGQTWEWDGRDWLRQDSPFALSGSPSAYDIVNREVVQFGGLVSGVGSSGATVAFRPTFLAATQSVGVGCGSPAPSLANSRPALLGDRDFALDLGQASAFRAVLTVVAAGVGANQSFGACTIVPDLTQAAFLLGVTGAFGGGALPFELPFSPALRGATVYAQAVVLDSSGPLFGLGSVSNALRLQIGD